MIVTSSPSAQELQAEELLRRCELSRQLDAPCLGACGMSCCDTVVICCDNSMIILFPWHWLEVMFSDLLAMKL